MSDSDAPTVTNRTITKIFGKGIKHIMKASPSSLHYEQSKNLYTRIGVKSHGTIIFPDNKSNRAEFIHIPTSASALAVKELLNKRWCKERPSLVISITGGAKDFKMKSELLRVLRRGLLKVARTTGAWIITGGTNRGIMKMVGNLVEVNRDRSHLIHLIGIATWGCISNRSKLNVTGSKVNYNKPNLEVKDEAPLEPNHTEFILVDDGTENKYGGEIEFRARLENAILGDFFKSRPSSFIDHELPKYAAEQSNRLESSGGVPVVLLVVEGGPNTVRTVREAVVRNNIPAIFLEGTGRCCDLFGKACRLFKKHRVAFEPTEESSGSNSEAKTKLVEDLKNILRKELNEQLRAVISAGEALSACAKNASRKTTPQEEHKNDNVKELNDVFNMVYECVDTRLNLLNVLSLSSQNSVEPDIDVAILRALLSAQFDPNSKEVNYDRKRDQFLLALEWNRDDIARQYIMKTSSDWEKVNLTGVFELALRQDKIGFIELLLDHGFSLTDAFRGNKLSLLYQHGLREKDIFPENSIDSLVAIYRTIFQPFIGDYFDVDVAVGIKEANYASVEKDNLGEQLCTCCAPLHTSQHKRRESLKQLEGTQESCQESPDNHMDVDKELFLWSVVTGKRHFARLFWGRSKNKICAALVAVVVCKKLTHRSPDTAYLQIAGEFEDLAVQILDRYFHTNPRNCMTGIIRQIPAYGNVTWIQLAIKGAAKPFMAHQAVQEVLQKIWYGDIDPHVSQPKIILLTFLPYLSGLLPFNDKHTKIDEQPTSNDASPNRTVSPDARTNSKDVIYRETDNVHMQLMDTYADNNDTSVNLGVPVRNANCSIKTLAIRYVHNVLKFIRAPYVKYLYNIYYHLAFLILFSYVLLCDFFPLYPVDASVCPYLTSSDNDSATTVKSTTNLSTTDHDGYQVRDQASIVEWALFFWIFTVFCEEVRQFLNMETQTLRNRINAYFKVFWNKLDMCAITLFYIGFTLRFLPPTECFCAARIILSVDLTLWFIRLLEMFEVVKRLGPKLVMIGEMITDFKFFLLLLTVFILGFGVSIYSILYGSKTFSWHIPRKIINLAYWQMFGELNALDTFEHDYTPNGYAAFLLLIAYMSIVGILLVNLLIAMLSYTFDHLQNDTDRIWKFQRYFLVREFLARPTLPPPFMILSHVWRIVIFGLARVIKSSWLEAMCDRHSNRTHYTVTLDEKSANVIETAEDAEGDEVYYTLMKTYRRGDDNIYYHDENRIQSPQEVILTKVRSLENQMQAMRSQQNQMLDYLRFLMDGLKAVGGSRVRLPEKYYFVSQELLEDMNYEDESLKQPNLSSPPVDNLKPPLIERSKSVGPDDDGSQSQNIPSS